MDYNENDVYKGLFYNIDNEDEQQFYEGGAHFSYNELYKELEKIANNDRNNNEENYDDYEDIEDNFLSKGKIHSSNNFFLKKNMSTTNDYNFNGNYSIRNSDVNAFNSISKIDNCYNTFAYGPLNGQSYIDINKKDNQENIFSIRAINYFYDFKYLAYSHRV